MDFKDRIVSSLINGSFEELFIILFILILIKRNDFLTKENWKKNLVKILSIYVLPMSILSATIDFLMAMFNIYAGIEKTVIKSSTGIVMTTLVVIGITNSKNKKDIIKIVWSTVKTFVFVMILETSTILFVAVGVGLNIEEIISSPMLFFTMSIPERVVQYSMITYFFIKKNSVTQVDLSELILNNDILKKIFTIFTITGVIILVIIVWLFFFEKAFETLSTGIQLFIIIIPVSLVIGNIFGIIITTILLYPNLKYFRKNSK